MVNDGRDTNLQSLQNKAEIDGTTPKDKKRKDKWKDEFKFVTEKQKKKENPDYQKAKLINKFNIKVAKAKAREQVEKIKRGNTTYAIQSTYNQQRQSNQRIRSMGVLGGRAEQLEIQFVTLDEVPFLHNLESARMRAGSPNNRYIQQVEKEVTDSFPD